MTDLERKLESIKARAGHVGGYGLISLREFNRVCAALKLAYDALEVYEKMSIVIKSHPTFPAWKESVIEPPKGEPSFKQAYVAADARSAIAEIMKGGA